MKFYRYLVAALFFALPTAASAQCSGIFAAGEVCGNSTAAGTLAKRETQTLMLDRAFGAGVGSILQRGAGGWAVLAPGAAGTCVTSAGAGVVLSYVACAPVASPALTGTPTAPTAAPGTNTTQLATTAFVLANAPTTARTKLSANQTWYYRKDGNNANTCLTDSAGGACLTVQAAINKAAAFDFGGFSQTVRRGSDAGTQTWTEDIQFPTFVGGGTFVLTGNGTASQTIFAGTSASSTTIGASFVGPTNIAIYGVSITCGASGRGIFVGYQATVSVGVPSPTTRFGPCGTQMLVHNMQGLIQVLNASIEIYGGGGCHVANGGQFFYESVTLTLTGTPNFSIAWWCQSAGFAQVAGLTIASGTTTGNKFDVSAGALIPVSMNPISDFPGSTTKAPYNGGAVGSLPVVLGVQNIAQLPTCNASWVGAVGYVYDNTINTWGTNVAGTGAVATLVWCNAGAWTVVGK